MQRTPRATPSSDVSVIMPAFNAERYVGVAIESVLRQEGVTLELIVRDDGSEDGTLAILRDWEVADRRVKVLSGPNLGPAACRNHCLEVVSGAFVAFLDHDDLWPAGRLRRQLEFLRSQPDSEGVFGETLIFEDVDADGVPLTGPRTRRVAVALLQAGLFRRPFLEQIRGFALDLPAADDFDLILRMVEKGVRIDAEPHLAAYYRLHGDQHTADLRFASHQTVRAIGRSLRRRRAVQEMPAPLRALIR